MTSSTLLVEVNGYDDQGVTPLIAAATAGHLEVCQELVLDGADIDLRKQNTGYSAFHYACLHGHMDIIQFLLLKGAKINGPAHIQTDGGKVRGDKSTPLHAAVTGGHLSVVLALTDGIECGGVLHMSDVRLVDNAGQSVLHRAAAMGESKLIEVLQHKNMDPNLKDTMGESPLFHAVTAGHIAATEELLKIKADPNIQTNNGQTPLRYCAAIASTLGRAKMTRSLTQSEYEKEHHTLQLIDALGDAGGIISTKDRYFNGVPQHLQKACVIYEERLANKAKGLGFMTDAEIEEEKQTMWTGRKKEKDPKRKASPGSRLPATSPPRSPEPGGRGTSRSSLNRSASPGQNIASPAPRNRRNNNVLA
mmetsp:Transcript_34774/g.54330  ORF Transcript_34774/g.54330 Transcript_34774/m.54330 type:complete len:363 (-) Transcript_34774:349-1437(-)